MKKWVVHHFQDLIDDCHFEDDRLLNEYIMYALNMIYPDMMMQADAYFHALGIDFSNYIV